MSVMASANTIRGPARACCAHQGSPSTSLYLQLDERQDGDAIQDYLNKLTGGRSVPRVFVGGKFIGGGDDTVAKQQSGELKQILQQAGAL